MRRKLELRNNDHMLLAMKHTDYWTRRRTHAKGAVGQRRHSQATPQLLLLTPLA